MDAIDRDREFTDFVAHRSPALLRTAYLLCAGDRGAAEDLLQDVLERVYLRRRRIRGDYEPYARAALANTAANRWRRLGRRVAETPLDDRDEGSPVAEDAIATRGEVARALSTLPPRMRAVIVLRYFDDLTEAETARALGCSVGTVKSQNARGLDRLRALFPLTTGGVRGHD
ncbi:SigE family RNA polymerase sigma factor [Actinokineospora soli]